ncbi:MAG: mechanosensitive ion channel protein MscS [Chloroflexota bacterium]|nr:MAG: mechanosensitive ion channel protein MscS [Chloroflexota bacterium]
MQWLREITVAPTTLMNLLASLLIILTIWLLRDLLLRVALQRFDSAVTRYQWRKISDYVAAVLIVLLVGPLWMGGLGNTATYFGLLSAGLAIALQPLIVNLAGWAFIMWRRPFSVGDRIQLGNQRGDVIDLRLFQFSLMEIGNWVDADQSTGRVLHVPNGTVFSEVVANYSRGFEYIWNEIPVLITFESNWQKAKQMLGAIAAKHSAHLSETAERKVKEASRRFLITYSVLTPTVYTSVKDSGVMLTIRYLCEPRQRRGSEQAIWEDILVEFARHSDIDFAYPTQRFYHNLLEGKAGTKPAHAD